MKAQNIIKSSVISVVSVALITSSVYAATYEITGNGSGGSNSLEVNQTTTNSVNQQNNANVTNNVNSSANTGGNSIGNGAGDGSITTGNASTNVNITNNLNSNNATIVCPTCVKPTNPPGQPTPTPTPGPQMGGGGSGGGNGGGGSGGSGGSGGGNSSGSVLGLSSTSGDNGLIDLLKILPAFISFGIGGSLLKKNA